jgi:hypothetical protein
MKRFADNFAIAIAALFTAAILLLGTGCAGWVKDRGMLVTEEGLTVAEAAWNAAYYERLSFCKERYAAGTPEANACFGEWYDADEQVHVFVQGAVQIMREYWTLRAAGQKPDFALALSRANALLAKLPPKASPYFQRVLGV